MPQRFLRPGITNSALWNGVPFKAQSLFIRILTLVDDYGRYDGRTSVILGNSFAVWNDQNPKDVVTLQQCEQMLQQLAAVSLIYVYVSDGKKVVQINQWQERVRDGVKEKWPKPTTPQHSSDLQQLPCDLQQDSGKLLPSSPSPSPSSTPNAIIPSPSPFDRFWLAYPKKVGRRDAEKSFDRAVKLTTLDAMLSAIESAKKTPQWTKDNGQFIPNPSTWLNQGRWDDQPNISLGRTDDDYAKPF